MQTAFSQDKPAKMKPLSYKDSRAAHLSSKSFTQIVRIIRPPYKNEISISDCLNNLDYQKSKRVLQQIAATIKSAKNLRILLVSYFDQVLTDNECPNISQNLKNLNALQTISLGFVRLWKITDFGIKVLSQGLKELNSLKEFQFSVNQCPEITDKSCCYLSEAIKRLPSLEVFVISFDRDAKVTDKGLIYLSEGLKMLTSLKYVGLNLQEITDVGLSSFCESLRNFDNLWGIHLIFWGENRISDAGIEQFGGCLNRLKKLELLDLKIKSDEITDSGMKSLGSGLKRLVSLKNLVLELECPQVSSAGLMSLMIEKPLSQLYFGFNHGYDISNQGFGQVNISLRSFEVKEELSNLSEALKVLTSLELVVQKFEWIENEKIRSLKEIELKLDNSGKILRDRGLKILGKELKKHLLLDSIVLDLERADLTDRGVVGFCKEIKNLKLRKLYLLVSKRSRVTNKGRCKMLEHLKGVPSVKCVGIRDESDFRAFLNWRQMIAIWKELVLPSPKEEDEVESEDDNESKGDYLQKKKKKSLMKTICMLFFCIMLHILSLNILEDDLN